ncbi:MAG: hypothetical protein LQ346_006993 [Caloplaca aetnensis]|nr:MAG: hypothetical protein LQ346_006993 [Caloplaca aetnensis]
MEDADPNVAADLDHEIARATTEYLNREFGHQDGRQLSRSLIPYIEAEIGDPIKVLAFTQWIYAKGLSLTILGRPTLINDITASIASRDGKKRATSGAERKRNHITRIQAILQRELEQVFPLWPPLSLSVNTLSRIEEAIALSPYDTDELCFRLDQATKGEKPICKHFIELAAEFKAAATKVTESVGQRINKRLRRKLATQNLLDSVSNKRPRHEREDSHLTRHSRETTQERSADSQERSVDSQERRLDNERQSHQHDVDAYTGNEGSASDRSPSIEQGRRSTQRLSEEISLFDPIFSDGESLDPPVDPQYSFEYGITPRSTLPTSQTDALGSTLGLSDKNPHYHDEYPPLSHATFASAAAAILLSMSGGEQLPWSSISSIDSSGVVPGVVDFIARAEVHLKAQTPHLTTAWLNCMSKATAHQVAIGELTSVSQSLPSGPASREPPTFAALNAMDENRTAHHRRLASAFANVQSAEEELTAAQRAYQELKLCEENDQRLLQQLKDLVVLLRGGETR